MVNVGGFGRLMRVRLLAGFDCVKFLFGAAGGWQIPIFSDFQFPISDFHIGNRRIQFRAAMGWTYHSWPLVRVA
jgi:hypothetical protein